MAKKDFDPINRDHPSNFEIQLDKERVEVSLYFANVLFQTSYGELQSLGNKD